MASEAWTREASPSADGIDPRRLLFAYRVALAGVHYRQPSNAQKQWDALSQLLHGDTRAGKANTINVMR